MKYRIEKLDDNDQVVATEITDVRTLDGVIMLQMRGRLSSVDMERLSDAFMIAFPGRKILLLPPDIGFVRIIPAEEG